MPGGESPQLHEITALFQHPLGKNRQITPIMPLPCFDNNNLQGFFNLYPYVIIKINFTPCYQEIMRYLLFTSIFVLLLLLPAFPDAAVKPNIIGPDMEIIDNNIIVSLSIENATEIEKTILAGIKKEIVFTVELLRTWKFWPDEFIVSKQIKKVVKYDNLRKRYRASSYNGIVLTEKHFENYSAIKNWIFTVDKINLANIKELDPSRYYIRIVVESKSIEQLPLIGVLMHFIPEVEMSLAKESVPFVLKGNQ